MAMEDAVILAKCLREVPGIPNACTSYEQIRRRVERIVAEGARQSNNKTLGPIGRALRDSLLPFVFGFLVTERSRSWLYGHHITWDDPAARDIAGHGASGRRR